MDSHTQEAAPDPIEAYLTDISRLLRRRLPVAWIEDAIVEARRHLEDRTEALKAEGMPSDQAKMVAVSTFGSAKEWARSVADSAYEDAGARRARLFARIDFFLALGGVSLFIVARDLSLLRIEYYSFWRAGGFATWLGMILIPLAAFRGRRSQSRSLAMASVLGIGLLFAYFSIISVETSDGERFIRRDVASTVRVSSAVLDHYREEMKLLRLGASVYRDPSRPVPASLLDHGRYIAPGRVDYQEWMMLWPSPLKRYGREQSAKIHNKRRELTLEEQIAFDRAAPYRVVATREEAALAWRTNGEGWIQLDRLNAINHADRLSTSREAEARPAGFDAWAGAESVADVGVLAAMLLLLEFVSASAGRWAFRWRKAPRMTTR